MITVDSNIWIFSEMKEYEEHEMANKKLNVMLKEGGVLTNAIIVSEVFHKLYRLIGPEESLRRTKNIVNSTRVVYLPIEKSTVSKALELTKKGMRINDAIIAQHSLDSKASVFTDDIRDFRKVKRLKIIKLR